MSTRCSVLLLLLALIYAKCSRVAGTVCRQRTCSGLSGGDIILLPDTGGTPIDTVYWKIGADKLVEWYKKSDPDYYQMCSKERCAINSSTGALTIKNLTFNLAQIYTMEVSGKQMDSITLKVFDAVKKPKIMSNCSVNTCNLTCKGEGQNVTWNNGTMNIVVPTITVEKSGNADKLYTCTTSNPVSSNTAEIRERDLFVYGDTGMGTLLAGALGIIILLLAAMGGFVYFYKPARNFVLQFFSKQHEGAQAQYGNKEENTTMVAPPPTAVTS